MTEHTHRVEVVCLERGPEHQHYRHAEDRPCADPHCEEAKAIEEASSILLSVKIQLEKRDKRNLGALTVVERELLGAIREWHKVHPVPTEVT